MSYNNPNQDSHGRSIQIEQHYRIYFADGTSRIVLFSEDELNTQLVKFKSDGTVQRYDELDVRSVVPVDQHGMDIEANSNDSPEDLLRAELKVDVAMIRSKQEDIRDYIDRAQLRMAAHYGEAFDDRLSENLGTMLMSGSDADAIFDACMPQPNDAPTSQRVSPVVNAVLKSDLSTTNTPAA